MIRTVLGNMQDLSMFSADSSDLIVHPWYNGYVDDVFPVWRECAHALRSGGALLAGFGNPVEYLFHFGELEQGIFQVVNTIPYADIEHTDESGMMEFIKHDGYIWSHTPAKQIQGQINAGFPIAGFYEDIGGTALDAYMNTSMVIDAIKASLS